MRYILLCSLFCLMSTMQAQNFVSTSPSNKHILLESFTGINSYYAAGGQAIAQQIYQNKMGELVWINWHAGVFAEPATGQVDYRSSQAAATAQLSGFSSYPAAMLNRRNFPNWAQNSGSLALNPSYWQAAVDSLSNETAPVNVAARASLDISTGQLQVVVESYYTSNAPTASNRLYVALLQDSLWGEQEGAAQLHPANYNSNNNSYLHRFVMHDFVSPAQGLEISNTTATSFQADTFYYNLPNDFNGVDLYEPQLKLAVWVAEDSSNVLNATYASMTITGPNPLATDIVASNWETDFDLICGTEADFSLSVKNLGTDPISSLRITYDVNSGAATGSYTANFSPAIPTGHVDQLTIPTITDLNQLSNNVNFSITEINALPNPNTNTTTEIINQAPLYQSNGTDGEFKIRFDNYPEDVSWELRDETQGIVVLAGSNYAIPDDTLVQPFVAEDGHCYTLKVVDAFGDGICCAYGQGFYTLSIHDLEIVNGSNFGAEDGAKFRWQQGITSTNALENKTLVIQLFPNPAQDQVNLALETKLLQSISLEAFNALGQCIWQEEIQPLSKQHFHQLHTEDWEAGVYWIKIQQGNQQQTSSVIIARP